MADIQFTFHICVILPLQAGHWRYADSLATTGSGNRGSPSYWRPPAENILRNAGKASKGGGGHHD
jgi:hypothetical protein